MSPEDILVARYLMHKIANQTIVTQYIHAQFMHEAE